MVGTLLSRLLHSGLTFAKENGNRLHLYYFLDQQDYFLQKVTELCTFSETKIKDFCELQLIERLELLQICDNKIAYRPSYASLLPIKEAG